MFLADFHIHSTFSDGVLSVPEVVDYYGQRGFGAIAITDHLCEEKTLLGKAARYLEYTLTRETFPIYREILESEATRAWNQYRMIVIPGVEISKNSIDNARSAHILALGIDKFISADDDVFTICRNIHKQGGLAIAAHPLSTQTLTLQTYYLWDRRLELAGYIDAWEVATGKIVFKEVLQSGLPMVANSDLHRPDQIFAWKTKFHCDLNTMSIFNAIRQQDLEFAFYGDHIESNFQLEAMQTAPLNCGFLHSNT